MVILRRSELTAASKRITVFEPAAPVREFPDCGNDVRERVEADLVANCLAAFHEEPLTGDFGLAHLRAIHAFLFQDLSHRKPGVIRNDTEDGWINRRMLKGEALVQAVP